MFDHTHRLILDLLKDGVLDGLRIDHIDGLLDPETLTGAPARSRWPSIPTLARELFASQANEYRQLEEQIDKI